MKKLYYYILTVFLLIILGYYYVFIKSDLVKDSNFLSVCKYEGKNEIKIGLATGFSYISNHSTKVEDGTLYIEIYTTTIGNIFNSSREIELILPITDEIINLQIGDVNYNLEELKNCRNPHQSVEEALEDLR